MKVPLIIDAKRLNISHCQFRSGRKDTHSHLSKWSFSISLFHFRSFTWWLRSSSWADRNCKSPFTEAPRLVRGFLFELLGELPLSSSRCSSTATSQCGISAGFATWLKTDVSFRLLHRGTTLSSLRFLLGSVNRRRANGREIGCCLWSNSLILNVYFVLDVFFTGTSVQIYLRFRSVL